MMVIMMTAMITMTMITMITLTMMIMIVMMITMAMTMIMQDGGGVLVKAVDGPCLSPAYNKPHLDHHYHHHSVQWDNYL